MIAKDWRITTTQQGKDCGKKEHVREEKGIYKKGALMYNGTWSGCRRGKNNSVMLSKTFSMARMKPLELARTTSERPLRNIMPPPNIDLF
jgi:hypothetical protein